MDNTGAVIEMPVVSARKVSLALEIAFGDMEASSSSSYPMSPALRTSQCYMNWRWIVLKGWKLLRIRRLAEVLLPHVWQYSDLRDVEWERESVQGLRDWDAGSEEDTRYGVATCGFSQRRGDLPPASPASVPSVRSIATQTNHEPPVPGLVYYF